VCNLLVKSSSSPPVNCEAQWVEEIVQSRIIANWESQDEPEHLRTIRNRIILLRYEECAARLLGLYQKLLLQGEIAANDDPEQIKLRLSGLVVEQQGKLRVFNRIYANIFDQKWVDKEIASLRPYPRLLAAWLASNCQDESRLLRGKALQDALAWAADKSLSNQDHQFLAASQQLDRKQEKLEAEIKLEVEKKEKEILTQAYEEAPVLDRYFHERYEKRMLAQDTTE
jgi:hypothetical protein